MTRATLTKTAVVGPYPTLQPAANSLDVIFAAANPTDKEQFVMSGNDVLLVHNTDVSNAYTFTVTSVADERNRTGDITTYSVGAGEIAAFKFTAQKGWMQSGGYCFIEASNAAMKFAVLGL